MTTNDKVVCVDDAVPTSMVILPDGHVVKGQVYCVERAHLVLGRPALVIVGKRALNPYTSQNIGWGATRFRLLSDVKLENVMMAEAVE